MEDVKKIWKDENFLSENLTVKDIENLLEYVEPWLESMELKFCWDYSVNKMTLAQFVEITMWEIYKIVNEDCKVEYELYPKQRDFEALWSVISDTNIDNCVQKKDKIWKLVENKILEIAKEVLD